MTDPASDEFNPSSVSTCKPGPWGELEAYETFLEAPAPLLKLLSIPSQQTVWHFIGQRPNDVLRVFMNAKLTGAQLRELTDQSRWTIGAASIRVFPPGGVVESLSARSRASIYEVLSQWEENPFHKRPIIFRRNDLRRSLQTSELEEDLVRAVENLIYTRGSVALFADLPVLLRYVHTARQERQLMRIITRTPTLVCRLKLSADSNLEEISEYWTVGKRQTDALPLLQAIVATREVQRLDLVHLFPAGARSQLYTFPSQTDALAGRAPDGVWTALNFFNITSTPLYVDSTGLNTHVQTLYQTVTPPYRFGDLLFLSGSQNRRATHACIFVADDIVYTKNSPDFFSPWVLMRLNDVIGYHITESEALLSGWRRNA